MSRWSGLAEVETFVDIAVTYAIIIGLCLIAVAILLPRLKPA